MTAIIVVLLIAAAAPAPAQVGEDRALYAKAREFSQRYQSKDYEAARRAADETIELARKINRQDVVRTMLYNKACVAAVTGAREDAIRNARLAVEAGYDDYFTFAAETDFQSLLGDADFARLRAELRAKAGIAPHTWDPARTANGFLSTFDSPSHASLRQLREEFGLDQVVSAAPNDYARLKMITAWVSRQWEHSSTATASKSDPLTILREAKAGGRFICRDYAVVLAGVATAYGLPARVLNLLPRHVETVSEAHSVAEVWVPSLRKWVLADGQYGVVAAVDGVPLNGVELQAALGQDEGRVQCEVGQPTCGEWRKFVWRNAFYFKFGQDQRRFASHRGGQLVLVPRGAPDPHRFAGGNEEVFADAIYISDPAAFYAAPRR
jgi:hypothetical protein